MEKSLLKPYIDRLLHIEEQENRFINLLQSKEVYFVKATARAFAALARAQYGKMGTVALQDSALTEQTKILADSVKVFQWSAVDGNRDVKALDKFKNEALLVTRQKGFNPLFLSMGAMRWEVPGTKGEMEEILSPLVIFPIRLVRSGDMAQPICIEFVEESVFINPSFLLKLEQASDSVGSHFPLPPNPDDINIDSVDFVEYFDRVSEYVDRMLRSTPEFSRRKFEFERDTIAIAKFNNPDICMYHDIKRNLDTVCQNPLIRRIFGREQVPEKLQENAMTGQVLAFDASQEEIILSAARGESLVVQGPPGTGKSQTVANIIATFLSQGKKVLFVSQKIAALGEVYNKLPAELRPFLLRMDYEAESMKIDANQVFSDLKNTLDLPKQDVISLFNESEVVWRRFGGVMQDLYEYREDMLDNKAYLGNSFLSLLDEYCEDIDGEYVVFDEAEKFLTVSYRDWAELKHLSEKTQDVLSRMSDNFLFHPRYSAWYGVKPEFTEDEALTDARAVLPDAEEAWIRVEKELSGELAANTPLGNLTVAEALLLSAPPAVAEKVNEYLLNGGDGEALAAIADENARLLHEGKDLIRLLDEGKKMGDELCELAEKITLDAPVSLLRKIWMESKTAFGDCVARKLDGESAYAAYQKREEALDLYLNNEQKLKEILGLNGERQANEEAKLNALCEALKDYDGGKIPMFAFALKKALKELETLTGGKCQAKDSPYFVAFWQKRATLQTSVNVLTEELEKLLPLSMHTVYQNASFAEALDYWKQNLTSIPFYAFIEQALAAEETVNAYEETFGKLISLKRVSEVAKAKRLGEKLDKAAKRFETALKTPSECGVEEESWIALSAYIRQIARLVGAEKYKYSTTDEKAELLGNLLRACKRIFEGGRAQKAVEKIVAFASKYMEGSAYSSEEFPLYALEIWKKTAVNRSYRDNAIALTEILREEYPVDFVAFTNVFLKREARKIGEYAKVFRHSFLKVYLSAAERHFGSRVEKFKRRVQEERTREFVELEDKILSLTARRTANTCASRYNPNSDTFAFLSGRNQYSSCRLLFKRKAREILMLKPCLVMSPSTVSQLLQAEDYRNFDAVILDEASQITPESCISALYRANQCVIFGDEYQMPAMRHFVAAEKQQAGELKKIASILDMIAQTENFPRKKLCSHFRSKTEMLIGYSQKRYYPEMITFPAVEPKSESCGFMPNGYVEGALVGGVNEAEAQRVYQALKEHFEKYYDPASKTLKKSVGVVAFGTPQATRINDLIEGDKFISKALAEIKSVADVYEKVFFIRTIENVQGNEMDCIILSLTYGRNASGGVTNSFAQLNRKGEDDLGEKLFNVAVTRAKESVLLVRSVHATDIRMSEPGKEESNIAYLRDYLANYERFSDVDDVGAAFVSVPTESGFIQSVVNALVASGIERERIVVGYGVNEKSVRLPIAVLSPDKSKAQVGILCEADTLQQFDYFDYTCRFPRILRSRGWNLYSLFGYEWVRNYEEEKDRLIDFVHANVTF